MGSEVSVEVRQAQPPALYDDSLICWTTDAVQPSVLGGWPRTFLLTGQKAGHGNVPWDLSSTFLIGEHGRSPLGCDGYVLCTRYPMPKSGNPG